jgi:hypothetical protein
VKMPCHLMLTKLAVTAPGQLSAVLDRLVEPLTATLTAKIKSDAGKDRAASAVCAVRAGVFSFSVLRVWRVVRAMVRAREVVEPLAADIQVSSARHWLFPCWPTPLCVLCCATLRCGAVKQEVDRNEDMLLNALRPPDY